MNKDGKDHYSKIVTGCYKHTGMLPVITQVVCMLYSVLVFVVDRRIVVVHHTTWIGGRDSQSAAREPSTKNYIVRWARRQSISKRARPPQLGRRCVLVVWAMMKKTALSHPQQYIPIRF